MTNPTQAASPAAPNYQTQLQIARVIFERIADGQPVTDKQRVELMQFLGVIPQAASPAGGEDEREQGLVQATFTEAARICVEEFSNVRDLGGVGHEGGWEDACDHLRARFKELSTAPVEQIGRRPAPTAPVALGGDYDEWGRQEGLKAAAPASPVASEEVVEKATKIIAEFVVTPDDHAAAGFPIGEEANEIVRALSAAHLLRPVHGEIGRSEILQALDDGHERFVISCQSGENKKLIDYEVDAVLALIQAANSPTPSSTKQNNEIDRQSKHPDHGASDAGQKGT